MSPRAITASAALDRLISGRDLARSEAEFIFGEIMDGAVGELATAGLLAALATKGESVDEIAGAAAAMRRRLVPIPSRASDVVDTCGTGGDGKGTFNISTAAAIVAAACGVVVAKHGNRSVSSRSGSADVLEALGVEIEVDPGRAGRTLDRMGLAFLFAPRLHPAMKQVMPVRRALGVRTIFNILGPLSNPAGARRQVLGVYDGRLVRLLAEVLCELGCDHAMVVRGSDGLDELTTTGPSLVAEVRGQSIREFQVDPADLGLALASPEDLVGGEPRHNAELLTRVLDGREGPLLDITALNAGAAIYVGGRSGTLTGGVDLARQAIRSGAARRKLAELRDQNLETADA